ncbi:glycoside hydrolase family 70 protein [Fructilactobacillus sanfranciscensis]|uniref:glycoside hydrolase family 70 protein n=1 Tax=Fructilactobacillus sanfranciscensis TaxID=1625 RepID=UPI0015D6009C|nr:glycoside hydrolase family 70 protein [Fructilactobacillus sanfranciscensis]
MKFNEVEKKRFKLYKAGKRWLIAGTTFLALAGLSSVAVHADSNNLNTQSAQSTVATNQDVKVESTQSQDNNVVTTPAQSDSNKQDNSATDSKNATIPAQTDSNKQDNFAAENKDATPAQSDSNKQDNSATDNKNATPVQADSNKQDNSATDNKNAADQANSTSVNSDTTSNTNANNQKVALLAANNQTDGWNTDHTQYTQGGQLLTGVHNIDGKNYSFASDGQLLSKTYGKIENGKLNIYDATSNKLLKTLDSGDWENLADSFDSSSINNIDGYLSYGGWYRPYGTSQDGKTWHKTTASDWRPLLMYVYPSKDVEAKYIKYFVSNGYTSTDYGLTKDNVANLSQDTDSATLNKYARNLRFVIEKSIAINKSTSPLANDINKFMTTIPELSAKSELPTGDSNKDQLVFVNNNSSNQAKGNTSYADSNYRLMDRTLNNQTNNDSSDHSPELLIGTDIDNSNPVVQAENFNWEYFLLNYGKLMQYNANGNFDGFRVDAADNIDADVLDQLGQLMNDLYHTKGNQVNANSHLVYNEGYNSGDARMLNGKNNPQLCMDGGYFFTLENVLGRNADKRDSINNLVTNSIVNRANDITENTATPNWSFVTNHDQRKNLINQIISDNHYEHTQEAWDKFYADQAKTDKQYAQHNLPAQYALLLSNRDTVPQVYYGDLYNETDQYMKTKSMYYDAITTLMKARRTFVNGGQTMTKLNNNLIASVRYGKGVSDVSDKGTDSLSRTTGMAVVVGNNPTMSEQVVQINMGVAHANEQYRSLINSTDNGLTYDGMGSAFLTTDSKGILRVTVKGYSNPYVNGYLSVWVPVISGAQDAQTNAQEVHNVLGKTFASNAALDAHMIYEDFSLFQPKPTTINNHAYNVIKENASLFNQLGITDFWMAPAYMPFNASQYSAGYAMVDHYNLGTTDNPTKYGSGEELANAIAALHQAGLKVQEDLVMNQMLGLSSQETVTVTRADSYGKQFNVDGQTFANQIYFGYTRGGSQGQQDYGGKYLGELKQKYPDLFTTKAASSGVAPDPNTRITEWSAKYENGTSLQNVGVGLAIKMPNGYYAYLNDGSNKTFNTTLPDAIASTDYYANEAAKAAAQKAHDAATKAQKAHDANHQVPAGTTTNINNVPNVKINANGTYTLPNNVVVNANGMAISIEGTDVVPNEFYVNDQGQIINLKGDVLQPVVALGQSETKASQKQSGLAQFTNPDTNKKNALPNTGEAKDNNLMAILGMLMVALAGIFGVADLKKAKHSAK